MSVSNINIDTLPAKYSEYVYSLRCPICYKVFYVGRTKDLNTRLKSHIYQSNIKNNTKDKIIQNIISNGLVPIMRVIEEIKVKIPLDKYHAGVREIYWIDFYKKIGWDISNIMNSDGDSSRMAYYVHYRKIRPFTSKLAEMYEYGVDESGKTIYDLKRMDNDGVYVPFENKKYDPFSNPRWLSKI
jgi:hypothetical protein